MYQRCPDGKSLAIGRSLEWSSIYLAINTFHRDKPKIYTTLLHDVYSHFLYIYLIVVPKVMLCMCMYRIVAKGHTYISQLCAIWSKGLLATAVLQVYQ